MRFLSLLVPGILLTFSLGAPAADPPNIILICTDDHGYADVGAQGSVRDLQTPHLDALARDGVLFRHGYVTAPQCVPSRAGLLTGRYQQRFGVEDNRTGPLPLEEVTLAERLSQAGYVTGMVGKWHLERLQRVEAGSRAAADPYLPCGQGFAEYFCGTMLRYIASHNLQGQALSNAPAFVEDRRFRVDVQTDAALSFIERHSKDRFFLYLAWFAPHVPLEAPEKYLARFPGDMPAERRLALAMISAMDDGVGRIRERLRARGLERNTLICFVSDNGAPLKDGAWDGSLNLPLSGEKGMLTDGGIRTPFIAAWPGTLPAGRVFEHPVISLDVTATAAALAGLPVDPALDGVNLMPYLVGRKAGPPHDLLFWRWRGQAAVRADRWKFLRLADDRRYLFDLSSSAAETTNLLAQLPELAQQLESQLESWMATLRPPGLPKQLTQEERLLFATHVDKPARRPGSNRPNILVIVSDDQGYHDVGIQGGRDIPTPHIDSIARNGVRFTSGYVSGPMCSPTRAGLMTGRYQQRFGHEHNPRRVDGLSLQETTLPERLQAAGYVTGMVGKWHLGTAATKQPLARGFQEFFGFLGASHSYLDWEGGQRDDPIRRGAKPAPAEPVYLTEAFGREAAAFIGRQAGKDRPFFLYLAFNAVHVPLEATEKYTARFPHLTGGRRRYAAMASAMDDAIGVVLAKLRDTGSEENTIVFFFSDNGGAPGNCSTNTPLRGFKWQTLEGGIRVPFLVQWKGHIPAGQVLDQPVIQLDVHATALAVAGVKLGAEAKLLDGANLMPLLTGQSTAPLHDALFWRLDSQMAIRQGNWKLVRHNESDRHELYDLDRDIGEAHDLALATPKKLEELRALWNQWNAELAAPAWGGERAERQGRAKPKKNPQ